MPPLLCSSKSKFIPAQTLTLLVRDRKNRPLAGDRTQANSVRGTHRNGGALTTKSSTTTKSEFYRITLFAWCMCARSAKFVVAKPTFRSIHPQPQFLSFFFFNAFILWNNYP
jgi:hypothetical protein